MIETTVLSLAALAVVACAMSLASGAVVWVLDRRPHGISAAARARVILMAALAPAVVATAVVAVALAPSVGLGYDHCSEHGGSHAHLCFAHSFGELDLVPWVVAVLFAARAFRRAIDFMRSLVLAGRVRAALSGSATPEGDLSVIDTAQPQAFVVGWLRPRVFVSRSLLEEVEGNELAAVLAHERAHGVRRDPLRRVLAGLGLSFHLPGIAGYVERRLELAHEMAADEMAARNIGDPARVAQALVRVTRLLGASPHGAAALGGSQVRARVQALLADGARVDLPSPRVLGAVAAALAVGAVALAHPLHHGLEHLLLLLF